MISDDRPYHHGDLKRALLAAAREELRRSGPDKLSLRACARAVGVDPSATYRHFASREDMLQQLAASGFAVLADTLEQAETAADPGAALVAAGLAYIRFATEDPALFQLMFDLAGAMPRDAVRGTGPSGRDPFQILSDMLRRARPELDAAAQADAVLQMWSTVHGFAALSNQALVPGDAAMRAAAAERLCAQVVADLMRRA